MGILPDHEPVLTVIKEGTIVVVDPEGERHSFEVTDGFISFDSNKLTVAVERGRDVKRAEQSLSGSVIASGLPPHLRREAALRIRDPARPHPVMVG